MSLIWNASEGASFFNISGSLYNAFDFAINSLHFAKIQAITVEAPHGVQGEARTLWKESLVIFPRRAKVSSGCTFKFVGTVALPVAMARVNMVRSTEFYNLVPDR